MLTPDNLVPDSFVKIIQYGVRYHLRDPNNSGHSKIASQHVGNYKSG
jgi:hypothetical protein